MMEDPKASNHKIGKAERSPRDSDPSSHDEEVLAWEPLGDDLWLPRRVRGSFRGGALG